MLDQTEDEDINPIVEVVEDIAPVDVVEEIAPVDVVEDLAPVDVVEDVDLVEEEVEEVTPLLADEELRLLVQQVSEDSELLPLDMEVIDINTDGTGEGFALINEDYIDPELEDDLDLDVLIPGLGEDIVEEEATATESVLESVVTTTASSLPEVSGNNGSVVRYKYLDTDTVKQTETTILINKAMGIINIVISLQSAYSNKVNYEAQTMTRKIFDIC